MTRKKKRATPKFKGKLPEDMQGCLEILKALQGKPDAGPFLEPVDWKRFDLPDYPLIIKRPMDLGTIEKRIFDEFYSTLNEFAQDVRLVWANAQKYNRQQSDIYKMSENLSRFFERRLTKLTKASSKRTRKRHSVLREVSRTDRKAFSELISQITSDQLGQLVETIREQCPGALLEEHDSVEIEIDKIDSSTLLDLNEYARDCIKRSANAENAPPESSRKRQRYR